MGTSFGRGLDGLHSRARLGAVAHVIADMRARWIAAALALLACGGAEWTDDPGAPGRAASMRFHVIESGTPVLVRPLDNSPLNMKVAKQITKSLRERGMVIADDAPLRLEFETAIENTGATQSSSAPSEPRRVDIGRERDLGRSDAVDARVDLYSNTRSSLLTGVRKPDRGLRYVLRATLAGRDGQRLWEGYAEYGEAASSDELLFDGMAELLAGMVGQTAGERRFRAD